MSVQKPGMSNLIDYLGSLTARLHTCGVLQSIPSFQMLNVRVHIATLTSVRAESPPLKDGEDGL